LNRYKLTFEYDGTLFSGWQIQPEARTVEGVIEQAFSKLYQQEIDIVGQGRTDAGVHALAQTAHVDLPDNYSKSRILHAMKGLLPDDVALKSIQKTDSDFHARFDAVSRVYQYRVSTRPSPLQRHVTWSAAGRLDPGVLSECSGLIMGEHDFCNFCIPPEEDQMTTICTILKSSWETEGDLYIYSIEGNRFLRHLVRRLVGTMVQVAAGRLELSEFESLLHGKERVQKGHSAPSHGLILTQVRYK
jgi:tRNA pseudouridine38-40 synthase